MANTLGIYCCNEKKNLTKNNNLFESFQIDESFKAFEGWDFFEALTGKWYFVFSAENNGTIGSEDILSFERKKDDIEDSQCAEYSIIVNEKHKESLIEFIKMKINQSNIRRIIFLCYLQEPIKERYYGVVKLDKFLKLLCDGKLDHNIAYIIGQ